MAYSLKNINMNSEKKLFLVVDLYFWYVVSWERERERERAVYEK